MQSERYRILHIIKSLGRGGAEMLLPETLKVHNTDEFEFHYAYFLPWKDQMAGALRSLGANVTCFPAGNNIQLMLRARQVAAYIRKNNINLVHAHLPWAGVLSRLVAKMGHVPVVYTEHNKQERYHPLTRWMNLSTMNYLDEIIAVSDDVAASVRKNKSTLTSRLTTIVNGVNTEHFHSNHGNAQAIRRNLGIPDGATVVGTIAVFRFQKKLDLWMEVAAKVLERSPNTFFVIVGDGPLKQELLEKRKTLGLEKRVIMPGLQPEVRDYLAAFDLYLMSSVFEGLPIALLEAMAMEKPIVSTKAGGIGEVIDHNVHGFLTEVGDSAGLINATEVLLKNETLRKVMGQNARTRVMESFSIVTMAKKLEDVYRYHLKHPIKVRYDHT